MILLSFDIEEFDLPLEHHVNISFDQQMRVSIQGTIKILNCLLSHRVKATFFCTARFAMHAPEIIKRIQDEGHEIASHGFNHSEFQIADLRKSKITLEEITGANIHGYRQPRMKPVAEKAIYEAGYKYNSSLNPTFIPGRYMNISASRTFFVKENVIQFPASVTPILRFPLFWLSCHHLPAGFYRWLCAYTYKHDHYLVVYFHPWEFFPLNQHPEYKIPFIIRKNSGQAMEARLSAFIRYFKEKKIEFGSFTDFMKKQNL